MERRRRFGMKRQASMLRASLKRLARNVLKLGSVLEPWSRRYSFCAVCVVGRILIRITTIC